MGGRGRSAAGKRGTAPKAPVPTPKAVEASDVHAKASEMGVKVNDDLINRIGAQWTLDELNRIDGTMAEFGLHAGDYITTLNLDIDEDDGTMAYTYSGSDPKPIYAVDKFYGNKDYFIERYNRSVERKYHPQGTTYEDVLVHETGHRIEAALARKALDKGELPYAPNIPLKDGRWNTDAYYKTKYGNYATEKLVSQATRNVKKTAYGKGKTNTELYEGISGYAAKNNMRSETFAEAIADWRRNGNNANPLSIEIVRLTKEYLNS